MICDVLKRLSIVFSMLSSFQLKLLTLIFFKPLPGNVECCKFGCELEFVSVEEGKRKCFISWIELAIEVVKSNYGLPTTTIPPLNNTKLVRTIKKRSGFADHEVQIMFSHLASFLLAGAAWQSWRWNWNVHPFIWFRLWGARKIRYLTHEWFPS